MIVSEPNGHSQRPTRTTSTQSRSTGRFAGFCIAATVWKTRRSSDACLDPKDPVLPKQCCSFHCLVMLTVPLLTICVVSLWVLCSAAMTKRSFQQMISGSIFGICVSMKAGALASRRVRFRSMLASACTLRWSRARVYAEQTCFLWYVRAVSILWTSSQTTWKS